MEKAALKDMTYGGLMEMIRNRRYYYHSAVGQDYSHFTEEGKQALQEYLNMLAFKMIQAEEADLEKRAQQQTLNILKGDTKK